MKEPNEINEYPDDNLIELRDKFLRTTCTLELSHDGSCGITITSYNSNKQLTAIFYPEDWVRFKNFINTHQCSSNENH